MTLEQLIKEALEEDIGSGDITSNEFVPDNVSGTGVIVAKEKCIVCGTEVAKMVFQYFDNKLKVEIVIGDGKETNKGDVVMRVSGNARSILACERTALNFLAHLSGIATTTAHLVKKIGKKGTILLDTRKTTPLLRQLEKYAVVVGGGKNHRFGLYDQILIKDNHIFLGGGIKEILRKIDALKDKNKDIFIELEVSKLRELKAALKHDINRIMLDNFTPSMVKRAIELRRKLGRTDIEFELSGGINEKNIKHFVSLDVEYISSGSITHSAKAKDFSLEFQPL